MKQASRKRRNPVRFNIHNVPRIVRLIETKSRMVIASVEGWGNRKLVFNSDRVSVLRDENCSVYGD